MRTNPKKLFLVVTVITIISAVIWYAYLQSRALIAGPYVNVISPLNGSSFNEPLIQIRGETERVSHIEINGRSIFIDDNGNFTELLLLEQGYNIIEIIAEDRFERNTQKVLQFTLLEE